MNYRRDIQGLRGIAVLLVLIYHLYPKKLSGGFIGVDIFFVISGFLVCYSIENRIKNQNNKFYYTFYGARIRRLFPASFSVILTITIYTFIIDFTYFSIFKEDAIASLLVYSNYKFYYNEVDYFHAGLKESLLLHYWSLSLEEQFYIIIPVLVWCSYNYVKILYFFLFITSFSICIFFSYNDKNKGYFFLSSRSWEFFLGALIRYFGNSNIIHIFYRSTNITVLLMILTSLYFNDKMNYPSYYALIPTLLSSYTIYSSNNDYLISNKLICIFGNLSYSIYLIHFPLKIIVSSDIYIYFLMLFIYVVILHNFVEVPFYSGCITLSDKNAFIISFVLILLFLMLSKNLNSKVKKKLTIIKHYSSAELVEEFIHNQRNYCCLNEKSVISKSSILFIGDSHLEQYIIALTKSKYKNKFQLLHVYIHTLSYRNMEISKIINQYKDYNFKLCIIGNYIDKTIGNPAYMIEVIYKKADLLLSLCDRVILSNDNPINYKDPNSCINGNKSECYGECYLPQQFAISSNKRIDVVTFWNENDIIKNGKCYYYLNNIPIFADNNHLSILYLKTVESKIYNTIAKYVKIDNLYKYDSNCPYYHMPRSSFSYANLKNQRCGL